MAVPNIINDGDFTVAAQNGSMAWDVPLAGVGDYDHIAGRIKIRVDVSSFKPSDLETLAPRSLVTGDGSKTCYLVGMSPSDIPGNNLIEFELTYANLPASRTEYTTLNYTQQWIAANTSTVPVNYSIVEFTNKRTAVVTYDYFFKNSPLAQIHAPRLEQIGNAIFGFSGWSVFTDGQMVIAEDSSIERYLGDIFVRKTPRIAWVQALPVTPDGPTIGGG